MSTPAELEIRRRIARSGSVPFAEFMDLALHGEGGYYAGSGFTTGAAGDFFTGPDTGPAFGRALARQVIDVWECAGRPPGFEIVEAGPGRGRLADGLLRGLAEEAPALLEVVTLTLDERSPSLRSRLEADLGGRLPPGRLRFETLPSRPPRSWTGVLLANELLDAMPVSRLVRKGDDLAEVCVATDDAGAFREITASPSAALLALAGRHGVPPDEGVEGEVSAAAHGWVSGAARSLERGALIFLDYGYEAADRAAGAGATVLAYAGHRAGGDLYARVGRQDITAHVAWDVVDAAAVEGGAEPLGRVTQDRFLLALGLGEELAAPADGSEAPADASRRLALRQLVMPQAMGRRFQVSAYGRGIAGKLRGLGPVPVPEPDLPDGMPEAPARRVRLVGDAGDDPSAS